MDESSYGEGLASHALPESCGHAREGMVEALTGAGAGRVLSSEILIVRSCRRGCVMRKATPGVSNRRDAPGPRGV